MSVHHLPSQDLGIWPLLIRSLVENPNDFSEFHNGLATAETLSSRALSRDFDPGHRKVLVEALKQQYRGKACPQPVAQNIERLSSSAATTVTTGHQLCLASGPLYFLSKISSVIVLARDTEERTGRPVIPVFWMASEDHDLEEVDHFHLGGERLRWNASQTGAVGRMNLDGLSKQFEEWAGLEQLEPWGEALQQMASIYNASTLADATRALVTEWFGAYGVVVLDGDDASLKRLFLPVIKEELISQLAQPEVEQATVALEQKGYSGQVHPRPINLFYLTPSGRHRLVREGEEWHALDTPHRWNSQTLEVELEEHPDRFSPNVVLRPVYQEVILPNLAYVGGPGEISYWLQLRGVFEAYQVAYPLLRVRHNVGVIPRFIARKQGKLELDWTAFFSDLHALEAQVAQRADVPDTTEVRHTIADAMEALANTFAAFDPSLRAPVQGEAKKMENALENLNKKALRAAKSRAEVSMRQLNDVHGFLFPGGVLQERITNVLEIERYLSEPLADLLIRSLDPHSLQFHLIELEA